MKLIESFSNKKLDDSCSVALLVASLVNGKVARTMPCRFVGSVAVPKQKHSMHVLYFRFSR